MKNLLRSCGSTRFMSVQRASNGPSTRASSSVWQQVVEQFPSAIAVADSEGCIVAMNRAFRLQLSSFPVSAESSAGVLFSCQRVGDQAGLIALVADAP